VKQATEPSEQNMQRVIIGLVACLWSAFQLALPRLIILDSFVIRAVHLAFGLSLVFLIYSFKRNQVNNTHRSFAMGCIMAGLSIAVIIFFIINRETLAARAGRAVLQDHIAALFLIVLVLEATRRAIGWPLVIIALVFTVYAFCSPWLPGLFAFKGVTLSKYFHQIALSTEGIFGIPLDVAANMVFLFVLLGSMMAKAGAGLFFNDLSLALLGRYSGGPAKAAIVSSGLTGMFSGSSIANVITTGTFTIPLMKKVGYPAKIAAATEVAASTNGQLMPPIMGAAAFVMAEYLAIPYVSVIRAAALPAFVSYVALFYITHLEARKRGMKGLPARDLPAFKTVISRHGYHLLPLIVLIYVLLVMRRSPQYAAFYAICTLMLIIAVRAMIFWISGQQTLKDALRNGVHTIGSGMISGARNMLPVTLATATAGIIVGIVNMGVGSLIVQLVETLSGGHLLPLLFITAVASLLIGTGLPTTATYIVMASVTVPVITEVGASAGFMIPLIAAHLFCFYFGILADDTPPVGLAAYAAAAIAESDPIETGIQGFVYDLRTAIIPFMFVLNPDLILYQVHNPFLIGLILAAAIMGSLCFVNVLQGWFLTKNRWYEGAILLVASLFFLNAPGVGRFVGLPEEWRYLPLIAAGFLYLVVLLNQKYRRI